MNMIETKNSSTDKTARVVRTTGLCSAALAVNLTGIVFIGYAGAMIAGLINYPLYWLFVAIKEIFGTNILASVLGIIPHVTMFLGVSALPLSVAAFNLYVVSKAAGRHKALFAQCLAITSITWALMGISLAVYLISNSQFTHISTFYIPISLIVGCLGQFWFAARIAKRPQSEMPAAAEIVPERMMQFPEQE